MRYKGNRIATLLILTACLFTSYGLLAQKLKPQHALVQFTVDNGLPSNEIYHIQQDSTGYFWVATANGVSQFDGYTFKNYGIDDGLAEISIHEIYIDYKGRIWFISASGRLSFHYQGKIHQYQYNHRLNGYIPRARGTVKKSFFVDSLDNVYISLKAVGQLVVSSEGVVTEKVGEHKNDGVVIEKIPGGPLITALQWQRDDHDNFIKFILSDTTFYASKPKNRSTFHTLAIEDINPNTIILSTGGIIKKFFNGKLIMSKEYGREVIWLDKDPSGNIWVSPIEGGVHLVKKGDFNSESNIVILEPHLITSTIQDNEGGFWFTSIANGIFFCPNINMIIYNEKSGLANQRISNIFANREGLYIGDEDGVLSLINHGNIKKHKVKFGKQDKLPIRFIGVDSLDSKVWFGSSLYLHSLEKGKVTTYYNKSKIKNPSPRQMIKAFEGGYWIGGGWGISKFDGQNYKYNSREDNVFSNVVQSVYQDSTHSLWLATDNGIWKYKDSQIEYLGKNEPLFTHSSSHIIKYKNNCILISTRGIGLLVYNGDSIKPITTADGIASNYINKIAVSASGVWLATNGGVSWITGDLENDFLVTNINTSHGLPTNETSDIFARGNQVYVSTSKGFVEINSSQIKPNLVKPKTIITELKANSTNIDITEDRIALNNKQNIISISFVGLSYKNMNKRVYRHRFSNVDTTWIYTSDKSSTFIGLPPDEYNFEVQSQNSDGLWGESAMLSFTIAPAFWQTIWFIVLATVIFSLLIFLVYLLRIGSIKRRNELINNLNMYKQKSLRQQMNPHFIFNTLNSIQLYILEKDHISSHRYLTKFAKLMRLVLDNSEESVIPLKNELEALKLYLELESLRLSGKFNYTINVENDKLLEVKVPTLLIQPFVENSIWHGIMLKASQDGWVHINVSSNNNTIVYTIEDNGVGRKKAQNIRSKQDTERKSLGFKITAQRINLLNSLYKNEFKIQYFDLEKEAGQAGTRVVITIPLNPINNQTLS